MRWQWELRMRNRDKLIVFIGRLYDIFETYKFIVLADVSLLTGSPYADFIEAILRLFNCLPLNGDDSVKINSFKQCHVC